jgi:predicted Zn-dependent peptidase
MTTRSGSWRCATLPNGLRVITVTRPGTATVAVRAYVRAGSRYDAAHTVPHLVAAVPPLGLAHVTEHMLFRGGRSHNPSQVFAAVEHLGGSLDAGTAKEYIVVSAVMPRRRWHVGLDVLAEVLIQASLQEDDLAQEKLIILQEIHRAHDHEGVLGDLFAETLWQAHPLRHPVLGSEAGVAQVTRELVLAFYQERFVAGNMLLVVCGDIDHAEAERETALRFGALRQGCEQHPATADEPALRSIRRVHLDRNLHQAQLLIGVPAPHMRDPERSAMRVVERVLGMGVSGRLYQRLRSDAGLAYSVNTVTAQYEDAGYFAVHTACDPRHVEKVERAVIAEWYRLARAGIADQELAAAKNNYAGTLARRFETNLALAGIFGVEGLLHVVETPEDAVARIRAVQREDVQRAAQKYLGTVAYVAVTVGQAA